MVKFLQITENQNFDFRKAPQKYKLPLTWLRLAQYSVTLIVLAALFNPPR
jgi:hypothetical protein